VHNLKMYINPKSRLIYYELEGVQYSSGFWDEYWCTERRANWHELYRNTFVSKITSDYLSLGSKVLDAGCGDGRHVFALMKSGYEALGLDNASQSINHIKAMTPNIDVEMGDVREMPYHDGSLDGIWSIGVIEHFFEGYDEILMEASRCLRVGGYLFLTFPSMNPFRYLQIKFKNRFLLEVKPVNRFRFYQYLLRPVDVLNSARNYKLVKKNIRYRSGLKGLKDASKYTFVGKLLLIAIHKSDKGNIYLRHILKIIDILFSPLIGHSCFIVFQKI